jgi:FO synthase
VSTETRTEISADVEEVLALPPTELMAAARQVRDHTWGTRVTYSPKVFIPLTKLCRDRCGYCTFAQPPAHLESPFLEEEAILVLARQGAAAGCHEALFTLGEAPEERYEVAREWLERRGWDSTVHYLAAMADLVREETGLLPHANAGALARDQLAALRQVAPSQGMMLESLRNDLPAHRGAPDKDPVRRLGTLDAAGELAIPFTTGILVGIGESRRDRAEALGAIADAHRRHGHVQEVIVQNFVPKQRTAMADAPGCPQEVQLDAIALARMILPPEIHLQAPPNLLEDFGTLLDAGIDDWGGVSPVTRDHVNPERPWPALARLAAVTESAGFALAPRLTVYPEHVLDPSRWLDERLHFAVQDRCDTEGLARDDPGSVFPQRTELRPAVGSGDGAEVVHIGARSTQWYAGASVDPPTLVGTASAGHVGGGDEGRGRGRVSEVLAGVRLGQEVGREEILALFAARGPEVVDVARVADGLRREAVGDAVTWVANRNINYTNVCTFKCRFCGFSKGPLSLNLRGRPYLLTLEDIAERAAEARAAGATEVCLQGGIHPDFDGEYYLDVARAVSEAAPGIHIHGFTALEVSEGARRSGEPLEDYLRRLMAAGLRTLPGTAAEILDDRVRQELCPDKLRTEEWLHVHRSAHRVGLRSNITIMFGSIEHSASWAEHLLVTRELQRETGGFTEFVGLPFVHMAAPIYLQRRARRGPTFREVVLMHAVARIVYRDCLDHVQASWVKLGWTGIHQLLQAGVDDVGGTLMDENISRAAGAEHGTGAGREHFLAVTEALGRPLVQRTTLYERIGMASAVG